MRSKRPAVSSPNGSMRERAYAHIQRKIASGELKPEYPISELVLAKELGMSRTPIREALTQLVAEGLLEQTANRGTLVAQLRRRDIVDLYELREALETYSARKAAKSTLRPTDLERWQGFCDEVKLLESELEQSGNPTLDDDQMHRFVAADLNFHNMLMHMTVNERISKVVNETRLLIRIFAIRRPGYNAATLDGIYQQHAAIIQSVIHHNFELVTEQLTNHIHGSLEEMLEAYDLWEREASFQKSVPSFVGLPPD